MATGLGVLAKAAFRLAKVDLNVDLAPVTNGAVATAWPATTAEAQTEAQRMGPYDLLPFLSEGINEAFEFDEDRTIIGKAGVKGHDVVSKLLSGPLEIQGHYLGMDDIFAAALGFEKPSYNDSPTYDESVSGDNPMVGATTAGTTGTALVDNVNSQFVVGNIGEWVRTADSGDAFEGQVRRITARTDADNLTISPAWTSNPGATIDYQISRVFTHTFECSTNLHSETMDSVYANYDTETSGNTADVFLRYGTLVFQKTVSLWEFTGVVINSLTFNYNIITGLTLSLNVLPYHLNKSSSINTASTTWDYSEGPTTPIHLQERIVGSDLTFRIDDWSAGSSLTGADDTAISDFTMTIENNLKVEQHTVSGLSMAEPYRDGFREVTGSFTVPRYVADTLTAKYTADTILMASLVWVGSTLTGANISSTNKLTLWIRALKLTGHTEPVAGAGVIVQTFNFRALVPASASSGMPAVTNASSEIVVQSTNNNPFNALRSQNGE